MKKADTNTMWIIVGAILVLLILGILVFIFTGGMSDVSRWFSVYKPSEDQLDATACDNACQTLKSRAPSLTCAEFKTQLNSAGFQSEKCEGKTCTVATADSNSCTCTVEGSVDAGWTC